MTTRLRQTIVNQTVRPNVKPNVANVPPQSSSCSHEITPDGAAMKVTAERPNPFTSSSAALERILAAAGIHAQSPVLMSASLGFSDLHGPSTLEMAKRKKDVEDEEESDEEEDELDEDEDDEFDDDEEDEEEEDEDFEEEFEDDELDDDDDIFYDDDEDE